MAPRPTHRATTPLPYDPWRHRFSIVLVAATLTLLAAGGLVTSTGSGLAVPDWPLSFGQVFPAMTGGVLFEHGHRMVAALVGLLTLVNAAWFARREPRPWARSLAWGAFLAVVLQGLLGGITVLLRLPPGVSVAHACLAQAIFALTVALWLVTSRSWMERPATAGGGWRVLPLAASASLLVYAQLVLGAVMRHTGAGLAIPDVPLALGRIVPPFLSAGIAVHYAHRVLALVIALLVIATALRAGRCAARQELFRAARAAVALVVFQIGLGAATVATRLAVLPATAHVVIGALLLAALLVVTLRAAAGGAETARAVPSAAREALA